MHTSELCIVSSHAPCNTLFSTHSVTALIAVQDPKDVQGRNLEDIRFDRKMMFSSAVVIDHWATIV